MTTRIATVFGMGALLAGALVATGCATPRPSTELIRARSAFDEASQGMTAVHNPDDLRVAERALAEAEDAHEQDPGSQREQDLAYVAERKIRNAVAQTEAELAVAVQRDAERRYRQALAVRAREAATERDQLDERLESTHAELARVQQELDARSNELSTRTRELERREQELVARQAELREQREARERAEQRAEEAFEALERLAEVRREQHRTIVTLPGSVLFESGKAEILPAARQQLSQVAEALKSQGDKLITVVGHTDSRGSHSYNLDLSQVRAEAVRRFLIDHGLAAASIRAVGRGESEPIADNATAEGRANNRRVELIVQHAPSEQATRQP